jgi:hypothetical protein
MCQKRKGFFLLLRRVVGKGHALADVALKALNCLLQESLLLLGNALQRVVGLLSAVGLKLGVVSKVEYNSMVKGLTHAELDGHGEEVDTGLLGNSLASRDARKVDIAGLYESLLTLDGAEDLLSEAVVFALAGY